MVACDDFHFFIFTKFNFDVISGIKTTWAPTSLQCEQTWCSATHRRVLFFKFVLWGLAVTNQLFSRATHLPQQPAVSLPPKKQFHWCLQIHLVSSWPTGIYQTNTCTIVVHAINSWKSQQHVANIIYIIKICRQVMKLKPIKKWDFLETETTDYGNNKDSSCDAQLPFLGVWGRGGVIICKILARDSRALHFNALAGGGPLWIAKIDILLKTRFFGLHFTHRMYWCIFNHFCVIRPKSYPIRRNNAN